MFHFFSSARHTNLKKAVTSYPSRDFLVLSAGEAATQACPCAFFRAWSSFSAGMLRAGSTMIARIRDASNFGFRSASKRPFVSCIVSVNCV
jgi:hypothetical protein